MRPASALRQLFSGNQPSQPLSAHLSSLRVIILERDNVTAEWESLRRATATGNWGTSPARQRAISANHVPREAPRSPEVSGISRASRSAGGVPSGDGQSLSDFAAEHHAWFEQVARLHPRVKRLHVLTERCVRPTSPSRCLGAHRALRMCSLLCV